MRLLAEDSEDETPVSQVISVFMLKCIITSTVSLLASIIIER
jgi:hypothetical protein